MKNKAIFKFNNGDLALLCSECKIIMKTGKDFTSHESLACSGKKYLKPQFCDSCKEKIRETIISKIVGKTYHEGIAICNKYEYSYRTVEENGNQYIITCDLKMNRINFKIKNDIIYEANIY